MASSNSGHAGSKWKPRMVHTWRTLPAVSTSASPTQMPDAFVAPGRVG